MALLCAQARERDAHERAPLARRGHMLGLWAGVAHLARILERRMAGPARDAGAEAIDRPAPRDGEQPAHDPATRGVVARRLSPDLDVDVLRDLLRGARIAEYAPGQTIHQGRRAVVDLGERARLTFRRPRDVGRPGVGALSFPGSRWELQLGRAPLQRLNVRDRRRYRIHAIRTHPMPHALP